MDQERLDLRPSDKPTFHRSASYFGWRDLWDPRVDPYSTSDGSPTLALLLLSNTCSIMVAKLFRDPVHGMIEVDRTTELPVIEHRFVQRLRRIHQLALTSYVYPGATHTRFEHALGTMELAARVFDELTGSGTLSLDAGERERKRRLLRLAALLHDVGHAAFSHAGEESLFPRGENHETFGVDLIRGDDLGGLIDSLYKSRFGITRNDVADLLTNQVEPVDRYLWQIISSPIDADKMDYLLRDAHYCGVNYGVFDMPRLVRKLVVHPIDPSTGQNDRVLGLAHGSIESYEGFFLARHWMNAQVYTDVVRRHLDVVVAGLMRDLVKGAQYDPRNLEAYLAWDDSRVIAAVHGGHESVWAKRLREPRPYFKTVYERSDSLDVVTSDSTDSALAEYTAVSKAIKARLTDKAHPDVARVKNKLHSGDEASGIALCIGDKDDNEKFVPVVEKSALLRKFPTAVTYFRIFVDPEPSSIATEARSITEQVVKSRKEQKS
jgi:HD superfamily phosphohydrolase